MLLRIFSSVYVNVAFVILTKIFAEISHSVAKNPQKTKLQKRPYAAMNNYTVLLGSYILLEAITLKCLSK